VLIPVAVSIFFTNFFVLLFNLKSPTYTDQLYCVVIVLLLFWLSKKNIFFVVNAAVFLFVFYISGALKLQYFGDPATPADIVSLIALYGLQSEKVRLYVTLVTVLLGALLFANFEYTKRMFVLLAGAVILLFSSLVLGTVFEMTSSDMAVLSNSPSVSVRQYYAAVHFYDEWLRRPGDDEVESAYKKAGNSLFSDNGVADFLKRDVYLIVIESFWDPSVLGDYYVQDAQDNGFKMLWKESGQGYLSGPSFGGGTANPEFEALCGAPLNNGFIVFEHPLLNEGLPCLPNALDGYGYLSVAAHPNPRNFWNRDFAYPAIGFDKYYSIESFKKDEVVGGNYLSDRSLYRQYADIVSKEPGPTFNYILTVAEHYPYMNTAEAINTRGRGEEPMRLLKSYVGLFERASRDVSEYIDAIRSNDKDALIVVIGDHPPLFGKDFAVYREAGLIVNQKSDMSLRELLVLYSTPILIVDGLNGVVKPAIKSMYEIPSMIMKLLTCYGKTCDVIDEGHAIHYRPVGERGVLYYSDGKWGLCETSDISTECSPHLNWLAAAKVLRNNLILGGVGGDF
jgi:phosphoglycerol transferase MdoB-like AlkP superfamily enzyme